MPELISRAEALRRIRQEVSDHCLMCALRDDRAGDRWLLAEDERALVVLPRYVRRWGQVLVLPRTHITAFSQLDAGLWQHLSELARRAACALEEALSPRRCYLASTGSAAGEITQSSAHLHIHVIPLYRSDDKPADIFSWSEGVYVAEAEEWRALLGRLREAWVGVAEAGVEETGAAETGAP